MQINNFSFEQFKDSILLKFINADMQNVLQNAASFASVLILNQNNIDIYKTTNTQLANLLDVTIEKSEVKIKITSSQAEENNPLVLVLTNHTSAAVSVSVSDKSSAELVLLQNINALSEIKHSVFLDKYARLKSVWALMNIDTNSANNANTEQKTFETPQVVTRSIELSENSNFDDHHVFTPQANVNVCSKIKITGEYAHSRSSGCLMSDSGEFFYEPIQEHFAPSSKSELSFNVVLGKRAKSFFRGLVLLHKDAQHSEAYQQNKNLLLSRNARADAEPRLEIIPNDVMCKHGSATAELDNKQLYYLMGRGFDYQNAKNLMIQGFCNTSYVEFTTQNRPFELLKTQLREHYLSTQVEILNT